MRALIMNSKSECYVKKVDDKLSIQLEYLNKSIDDVECRLTFYNTLKKRLIVNEFDKNRRDQNPGWLSGIWGRPPSPLSDVKADSNDVKLFLGYVQLFGYVVLNYKFGMDDSNSVLALDKTPRNSTWWANKEYLETYADTGEDVLEKNAGLDSTPFTYDNLVDPMIIGGKLGGVNDLVVEPDNVSKLRINSQQRIFLNDLVCNFNSYKNVADVENDGTLWLKELIDGILPFYATSQSLLFSDLVIDAFSEKSFRFKFPNVQEMPPSYNTRLTSLTCDQGLISIRYLLILGFLKMDSSNSLLPVSVYYPFVVNSEKPQYAERYQQPDYLQHITIDKSWQITILNDALEASEKLPVLAQDGESDGKGLRDSFLNDLDNLISSDIYNIPKMSSSERKKSFHSLYEVEEVKQGYIVQLPVHLKNQYQILVNNNQLCLVTISKPYYHLGEDIQFSIDINPETADTESAARIIGVTVHLEAHEIFHLKDRKRLTNVYRVSQNVKINSFAVTMMNLHLGNQQPQKSTINGYLNIPYFITHQFQSSKFMDLKYFLVFKSNLMQFDKHQPLENGSFTPSVLEADLDRSNTHDIEAAKLIDPPTDYELISNKYAFTNSYKFNNSGNDFTFRMPIVVLP